MVEHQDCHFCKKDCPEIDHVLNIRELGLSAFVSSAFQRLSYISVPDTIDRNWYVPNVSANVVVIHHCTYRISRTALSKFASYRLTDTANGNTGDGTRL